MSVTSAKYVAVTNEDGSKTNSTIKAVISGVEWSIPLRPNNRLYQEVQEWVAAGNTIEEAD